jgi:hypothetical protein
MMAWTLTLCQLLVVVVEDMGSGEFVDNSRPTMAPCYPSALLASDFPPGGGGATRVKQGVGRVGEIEGTVPSTSTSSISDIHLLAYISTAEQGNRF